MFPIQILGQEEQSVERVFRVELYDPSKPEGEDTLTDSGAQCKVILSDQEVVGSIGFVKSEIRVSKANEVAEIQLERVGGCQGEIICTLSTEQLEVHTKQQQSAQDWVDFVPKVETIVFRPNETTVRTQIDLIKKRGLDNSRLGKGQDRVGQGAVAGSPRAE